MKAMTKDEERNRVGGCGGVAYEYGRIIRGAIASWGEVKRE